MTQFGQLKYMHFIDALQKDCSVNVVATINVSSIQDFTFFLEGVVLEL